MSEEEIKTEEEVVAAEEAVPAPDAVADRIEERTEGTDEAAV